MMGNRGGGWMGGIKGDGRGLDFGWCTQYNIQMMTMFQMSIWAY